MRFLVALLLLLVPVCCFAETSNPPEPDYKLKVINTFLDLAWYNPHTSMKIISSIENRDENCSDLGCQFVQDAYSNNANDLSTTECKIIWKAILVTVRTGQNGFDLMDVPTPWLD
jgi:hypothetical protein